MLSLADVLGFRFAEGTVGMASTVLVAGLLGTACLWTEDGELGVPLESLGVRYLAEGL